jgi:hypothetical protein
MKLSDLQPEFCATETPGVSQVWFTCPIHGKPNRITVNCHSGPPNQEAHLWNWTAQFSPAIVWDSVTIAPSINLHSHGRKPCGWHGNVTNGEVTPANSGGD